jgi:hypothetical protein
MMPFDSLNETLNGDSVDVFYRSDSLKSTIPSSIASYRYMLQFVKDLMASQPKS